MAGEWSSILITRAQFQLYVTEQHQSLRKVQALERKYASSWAGWGDADDVSELLALSRGNMLRTNAISTDLMAVMPTETRTRLGMGKNGYYDLAQTWATQKPPGGIGAVVRDLELWKAPVAEGVRRACSVIGQQDPVRWTRRVGLMDHCILLDVWLAQLDDAGGLDGAALQKLSMLIREYYVGAVASVSTYMRELTAERGENGGPRRSMGVDQDGGQPYASS